jgi:hypothetical protein
MASKKKPKAINWKRQPLGKVTDRGLARKLGVTPGLVRKMRTSMGIPVSKDGEFAISKGIQWDDQPLGLVYDTDLAKTLGCTSAAVRRARLRRGIESYVDRLAKRGLSRRGRPLNGAKASKANSRKGQLRRTISGTKPGVHWDSEPHLGMVPDHELAEKYGVTPSAVAKARHVRGIPAAPRKTKAKPKKTRTKRGIDWDNEPIGQMPDKDLGLMLGVTGNAVAKARADRDVPPYEPRRGTRWTND